MISLRWQLGCLLRLRTTPSTTESGSGAAHDAVQRTCASGSFGTFGFIREKETRMMSTTAKAALVLCAAALFTTPAGAQESLRVSGGEVTVICPLTVGGSFEAKTQDLKGDLAIAGDSKTVNGALTVDLQTLETGIGLRDKHLKANYLEVEKGPEFAEARLQDIRVDRLEGETPFRGVLTLHGQRREVTGTAQIKPDRNGYRMEATFPVKVADFQIPEPTYLGVGVADEVTVKVNLNAIPAATAVGTSGRKPGKQ
jgi:polyisoprenoid-binding protein YceI